MKKILTGFFMVLALSAMAGSVLRVVPYGYRMGAAGTFVSDASVFDLSGVSTVDDNGIILLSSGQEATLGLSHRKGTRIDRWLEDWGGGFSGANPACQEIDDSEGETSITLTYVDTNRFQYVAQQLQYIRYRIVFNPNGAGNDGHTVAMGDVNKGLAYNEAQTLTKNIFVRSGYVFGGWSLNSNGTGTVFTDEQQVTGEDFPELDDYEGKGVKEVTLYAIWVCNEFVISTGKTKFGNGTVEPVSVKVAKNSEVSLHAKPDPGSRFLRWMDDNSTNPKRTVIAVSNAQYVAKFEPVTVNVNFDVKGDDCAAVHPNHKWVTYGNAYGKLPKPVGAVKKFIQWKDASNAAVDEGTKVSSVVDHTLFADWDKQWSVKFWFYDDRGEQSSIERIVNNGEEAEPPALSEVDLRLGYRFKGWDPNGARYNVVSNAELEAVYTPNSYSVVFNGNGGGLEVTGNMGAQSFVYDESQALAANAFSREDGALFLGWNRDAEATDTEFGDGQEVKNLVTGGSVDLYAIWKQRAPNAVKFWYYDSASARTNVERSVAYGKDVESPDDLASHRPGYAFNGWSPESALHNVVSNVAVEATYLPNCYTVAFNRNGGDEISGTMNPQLFTYGETHRINRNLYARHDGVSFLGWSRNAADTDEEFVDGAEDVPDLTTQDGVIVNLYAIWRTNGYYRIKFELNNASSNEFVFGSMPDVTRRFGEWYRLPACAYTNENWQFCGWGTNSTCEVQNPDFVDGADIREDLTSGKTVTLYALWRQISTPISEALGCEGLFLYCIDDAWDVTKTGTWFPSKTVNGRSGGACAESGTAGAKFGLRNGEPVVKGGRIFFWAKANADGVGSRLGYKYSSMSATDGEALEPALTTEWQQYMCEVPEGDLFYICNLDGKGMVYVSDFEWNTAQYRRVAFEKNGTTEHPAEGAMTEQLFDLNQPMPLHTNCFVRGGYAFDGWAEAQNGEKRYDDGGTYEADTIMPVTLYAKWRPIEVTVDYDANGGEGEMVEQVLGDDEVYSLSTNVFTRARHTFAGWQDAQGRSFAENEAVDRFMFAPETNVVLSAQWAENAKCAIRFEKNGGAGDMKAQEEYCGDTNLTLVANAFTRTGYTFKGWNTAANGTGTAYADGAQFTVPDSATLTLYAQWQPIEYTIAFEANGGEGKVDSVSAKYDTAYQLPTNGFTLAGCDFGGWTNVTWGAYSPGAAVSNLTAEAGATITFKAVWKALACSVSYDANGGTGEMQDLSTIQNTSVTLASNKFTRIGYAFSGWNTAKDGTGTPYGDGVKITTPLESTLVLFAQWTAGTYVVRFDGNGADSGGVDEINVTYGESFKAPSNGFVRAGYDFYGWTNAEYRTSIKPDQVLSNLTGVAGAVVTFYAEWDHGRCDLTFDPNGGAEEAAVSNCLQGASITLPVNGYARTGYTANGWNTAADGTGEHYADGAEYELPTSPNAVLYAQWTNNHYTVTFDGNGSTGGGVGEVDAFYDLAFALPPNGFARTHYTFTGWQLEGDDAVCQPGTMVSNLTAEAEGTVTCKAQWSENAKCAIRFEKNGGIGSMDAQSEYCGDTNRTLVANAFTRTGYTFKEWNTAANGTGTAYGDGAKVTVPSAGVFTLYAQWQPIEYTIAFEPNGGEGAVGSITAKYGTAYQLPTNGFTKSAYDLVSWTNETWGVRSLGASVSNLTAEAGATISFKAVWDPAACEITFNPNGATSGSMDNQRIAQNTTSNLTACGFSRIGYTFDHWNDKADGSGELNYTDKESFTAPVASALTLFAQWKAITYKIQIRDSVNNKPQPDLFVEIRYDEDYVLPADKVGDLGTHSHQAFECWTTEKAGTGTRYGAGEKVKNLAAANGSTVALYAQWTNVASVAVTFNGNGADGGSMSPQTFWAGDADAALTSNAFACAAYDFGGWTNRSGIAYADGAMWNYTKGAETLYAVWKKTEAQELKEALGLGSKTVTLEYSGCSLQEGCVRIAAEGSLKISGSGTGVKFKYKGTAAGANVGFDFDKNEDYPEVFLDGMPIDYYKDKDIGTVSSFVIFKNNDSSGYVDITFTDWE